MDLTGIFTQFTIILGPLSCSSTHQEDTYSSCSLWNMKCCKDWTFLTTCSACSQEACSKWPAVTRHLEMKGVYAWKTDERRVNNNIRGEKHERNVEDEKRLVNKGSIEGGTWGRLTKTQKPVWEVHTKRLGNELKAVLGQIHIYFKMQCEYGHLKSGIYYSFLTPGGWCLGSFSTLTFVMTLADIYEAAANRHPPSAQIQRK